MQKPISALVLIISVAGFARGGYAQRTYTILHPFGGGPNDVSIPGAGVIEGSDGFLCGTTANGGTAGHGAVYRVAKNGSGFALLHSFIGSEYGFVTSAVIEGSDGALYGTVPSGGGLNGAIVYRVTKDGTDFSVLHHFVSPEGTPGTRLLEASDGALYGVTGDGGGPGDPGTIFTLNEDGTDFQTLFTFYDCQCGTAYPSAGLVEGTDGALYGVTTYAPVGSIFKINKDGTDFTILRHLDQRTEGSVPIGELLDASDNMLYGTTNADGGAGFGTLFRIGEDGSGFELLHAFGSAGDGQSPQSPLVEGSDGTLYGVTPQGGTSGYGVVFSIQKDGSGYSTLMNFTWPTPNTGITPQGIILGGDGALYGTNAYNGGGIGNIFQLTLR